MRHFSWGLALVLMTAAAFAREPKAYQDGKLLQMDAVACGMDAQEAKSHELLCQEYVVQAEQVVYRVRAKNDKHPLLLPVGESAKFRLEKNKMLLRVDGSKERQYIVVSVKPRGESTADASPTRANHLQ